MASQYAQERQQEIRALVDSRGRVSVAQLAKQFSVTQETVRRDLDVLEDSQSIRRVHGGAIANHNVDTVETSFRERTTINSAIKDRIATAAAEIIPAGFAGSILLDAGSTTAALASVLAHRNLRNVTFIVNSLQVASALADSEANLLMLGGQIRSITNAAVGPDTVQRIRLLRPNFVFLGTNGIDADFGLSTPDPLEAAVKGAMVTSAQRRILLADDSKFETVSLMQFSELADIDILVTNAEPPEALASALTAANVKVKIV